MVAKTREYIISQPSLLSSPSCAAPLQSSKYAKSVEPIEMASLNLFFTPINTVPRRRVCTAATAAKSSGGSSQEKGLLDFILGGLQKEDQLLEIDPILKKVEEKDGGRKNPVAVPPPKKKDGGFGFGGLFSKNEK